MQLSHLNHSAKGRGSSAGSLGALREMLKPGLSCSSPTPQLRADGSAAAGSPFAEEICWPQCLPWEPGGSAVGSASQGLSKTGP